MCKLTKDEYKRLKQINRNAVHDAELDSFEQQLLELSEGKINYGMPFIVSKNTKCLNYIPLINQNFPLTMNISTAIKIREKHQLGYSYVSKIETMLKDSWIGFESATETTSVIIALSDYKTSKKTKVAICRYDKRANYINVNELTSIYDKTSFRNLLVKTWESDKRIFKNKKTEHYVSLNGLQLPKDLMFALSTNYNSTTFSKNQFRKSITKKSKYDISLLGLSKKYENILRRNGVDKINILCANSSENLLEIKGLGTGCLTEIETKLSEFNLKLRAE